MGAACRPSRWSRPRADTIVMPYFWMLVICCLLGLIALCAMM